MNDSLNKSHTREAIIRRLKNSEPPDRYLKDFVYGAIDGAVTTFAVVAGSVGANLSPSIVVVLGLANLLADGFSMGASNYLGTQSEKEVLERTRKEEESHIELVPEGEREELREIFSNKGFSGPDLERIVAIISSNKKQWVDTMLQEEHGLSLSTPTPLKSGWYTFVSFNFVGLLPLIPFIIDSLFKVNLGNPMISSSSAAALAFFFVGAMKGKIVHRKWYASGLETLFVGGTAAVIAYSVGRMLKGLA